MTSGSLGARRHRITLMGEASTLGAGGRINRTTPVIADVWAEVEAETQSVSERAEARALGGKASFRTSYRSPLQAARFAEWQGVRFRLESFRLEGVDRRTMVFDGVSIR